MRFKLFSVLLLAALALACGNVRLVEIVPADATAIPALPAGGQEGAQAVLPTPTIPPTATPIPTPAPTPTITPTPLPPGIARFSTKTDSANALQRHGLIIAFVIPLLVFGIPWAMAEIWIIRHVQPRSVDLTDVRIKAQDGLFIEAVVSMTARKRLTLASATVRWSRVRNVVEKAIEPELIHQAVNLPTLGDLEVRLKDIAEKFTTLSVIGELSRDFGVEVLRFNIEIRYTPETMEALKRRADASAGGQAYVAYALAAHLDPDSGEARDLYSVFQRTSSQVDAARNLGGGIANVADLLNRGNQPRRIDDDDEADD